MHLKRVFRLINLLDVPEKKRRFWPQHSVIVIDSKSRTVIDVIQHFENNSLDVVEENRKLYPDTRMIFAQPGSYETVEALKKRIDMAYESKGENTYVVGKGLVKDMSDSDKKKYLLGK